MKVSLFMGHTDPACTLRVCMHVLRGTVEEARKVMGAFFEEGGIAEACAQNVPSLGAG
ncbi:MULTISPECIES: hypothetical protein [Thermomonosporaceae]|uniref:hypothetical protein n=1 Tax=Thermomonosporaceae TaxID=2012 RepID=UPI00255AED17|nr:MULTISPECIES: hypothetical protein [Thermomonosporaceae]MDL4777190.1 hypothetical protein [Actinomadura xylanilytica]